VSRRLILPASDPSLFSEDSTMTTALELSYLHHDTTQLHDLYDESDGLHHLALHAGAALEGATPQEVLQWAYDRFGDRFVVATSMAECVLPHMAGQINPGARVIFLDTGYHFAETLGTADAVESALPISLMRIRPRQTVGEQDAEFGKDLWSRDPDLCCKMRKVQPLRRALKPYLAWASGILRAETEARRGVGLVEWDSTNSLVKVNPLAQWTQDDVDRYVRDNGLLSNPLLQEGYGSIGCAPCTKPGEGRSGRWNGTGKVECGIHA
jgi:phosphoadenosine phosphosulfate reductase